MTTLLTLVEAKSKTVSHERLLEIINNEHVQVRKATTDDDGNLFRIYLTSDLRISTDEHFKPEHGLVFIGQGIHGKSMINLLHQWILMGAPFEIEEDPLDKDVVLARLGKHIDTFHGWLERSRGW